MALTGNVLPDNLCDFEGNSHAYTAGSNTALALNTGGAISGNYSLKATATPAAGSVTLTSARFSVTAGTNYEISVPIRINQTKAGRVFTVTVTWYSALSGGSSLGTASNNVTIRDTDPAGWWVVNYNAFYATAPAGAVAATLTLTVTNLALNEYVHFDRIEFAPTVLLAGNLLDYNTQSGEKDVSGWTATNATLFRYGGYVVSGTGSYLPGATSSAAGLVTVNTASRVPVTAGTEYRLYLWLWHNVQGGRTPSVAIRWYDGSGALVGTASRDVPLAYSTTTVTCSVGVAPAGAVTADVAFSWTAAASGELFYFDQAWLRVAPNADGNLLTYDEYSTESLLPSWTVQGPGTALQRATLTSGITDGYFALKTTPTDSGIIRCSLDRLVPVVPGTTYRVGAILWRYAADSSRIVTSAFRTLMDWYDADENIFQSDDPDQFYSADASGNWYAHSNTETRTAPEGAAYARVIFEINHSANGADSYYVDNVTFSESTPEYTLAVDDERGCITYTINSVPPTGIEGTISVYRVHQDGTMVPLRGYGVEYDRAPFTSSPLVIEDYEAPLGQTVWYKTDWYHADGSRGQREYTQTIRTPVLPDPDYVWFKSPGLPATNTKVMMEAPPKWQRSSRSTTYDVVGRKNPVHVTGKRAGRTAQITLLAWDEPSNELFNSLLDSGLPALIQAMPGYGIDGNLYVSVGDSDVESITGAANEPGWRWTLPVTEIDRPSGGLQGSALLTWQSVTDAYETWEDLFDAHESWAEVLTEG
ncbi:hypothetical protein [Streptomyces sp. SID8499]|uniref:hypothetical protein n=1 Tax=Streptomyces sp. SID8499 TaxID=2706106 RepID=UPI0013C5AF61|nr:hypothetical protein [Streptomyces sp. SID8499]NED36684.1 hypothetical protein [Streptomyces sp. SID8499]